MTSALEPSSNCVPELGLADQMERARLEKLYAGAEQSLKEAKHVTYESRVDATACEWKVNRDFMITSTTDHHLLTRYPR